MNKSDRAKANMMAEMNRAGYVEIFDDFDIVRELGDRWVFLTIPFPGEDGEDAWIVGTFFKATATKGGDYAAAPIGEFSDRDEALKAFDQATRDEA